MNNPAEEVRHPTVMDDESRHVGRVYAEALFRASEKANQTAEVLADLEALVNEVFRQDPGLELFLATPAISTERKAATIERAFAGRAADSFTRFLLVLNAHGRLDMLRAIAQAFRSQYDRSTGHVLVHVRSAVPLIDAERERLREDIRAVGQREPVLQETVDPTILGGLIVRVRDWVYDASVRTRLQNLQNQLIERSSHAITGE
jgi:F-type H+-transporting ATPase subunit delta